MSRLFIIGAGVSHALADLPLGRELAYLIFQKAQKTSPADQAHYKLANGYKRVWRYLQDQVVPEVELLQKDGTQIETLDDGSHPLDLEYLLTLIDLNLNAPYIPKGIGVDLQGCPIPYLREFNKFILEDARNFILHQIYEIFKPPYSTDKSDLIGGLVQFISRGDSIITFNYDLLLEQAMFTCGKWNPLDGYGIGGICADETMLGDQPPSEIELIKLHGSINWSEGSMIVLSPDLVIHVSSYENECFFQGMQVNSSHKPYHLRYPRNPIVVMPTYLKLYDKAIEVELVNKALDKARTADEVYILGYSIPKADVTANLIVSQIRKDAKVVIVNRSEAEDLRERFIKTYGFKSDRIIHEQSDIREWIKNDFQYRAYDHWKEGQEFFESMKSVSVQPTHE